MISISFIIYFLAVFAITATMVVLSHLLNPAPTRKRTNFLPFESGIVPTGSTELRLNVNYYLVAILFVIFDMEAVFLYLWSGVVLDAGWPAFLATTFFIFDLLVALIYEWRMGVLDWGKKQHIPDRSLSPIASAASLPFQNMATTGLSKESSNALETH